MTISCNSFSSKGCSCWHGLAAVNEMTLKSLVSLVSNLIGLAEGQRNKDAPLPSYITNFNEDCWCCVCLSRLKARDEIRVLPCSHKFHKICVNRWLKGHHKTCPLCRFSLVAEDKSHRAEIFTEEMLIWFSSFHVAGMWYSKFLLLFFLWCFVGARLLNLI